jgi:SAM-dependent methyltransferase
LIVEVGLVVNSAGIVENAHDKSGSCGHQWLAVWWLLAPCASPARSSRKAATDFHAIPDEGKTAVAQCILCYGNSYTPVIREGGWQYFRCRHCGLVFLHPQPTESYLTEHYQHYLPDEAQNMELWRRMMLPVMTRSATLIERRVALPGRLLDVGCGHGFFLEIMAQRGWKVEGIEISATGREYARQSLKLEVSEQPLPRPDWPAAQFDVITLFYVIEHLADPRAVLTEVRRLLRPGGLLLLRWPHTTPLAQLLRPWAESLKLYQAPSHLFDFSPRTIARMLTEVGFQDIQTTIGGWTQPEKRAARLAAAAIGRLGEHLARLSRDRWLLPGASKTTLAI